MRAAQEGHLSTVKLLLTHQANVNKQNDRGMTALMLAVQRGHVDVCQLLIDRDANINLQSKRKSTALLIACKLGYVAIVKILLIAGCKLDLLDRANLTARHVIQTRMRRREAASATELQVHPFPPRSRYDSLEECDSWMGQDDGVDYRHISIRTDATILQMLHPGAQFSLIQHSVRQHLSYEMIRMHTLVDQNRANVRITDGDAYDATNIVQWLKKGEINTTDSSAECTEIVSSPRTCLLQSEGTQILPRTMLLPAPLVKIIALYIPLPNLWKQQIAQLKEYTDPSEKIFVALDILDEMLESRGFLSALDTAKIPAPNPHLSWSDWLRSSGAWGVLDSDDGGNEALDNLFSPQQPHSSLESQSPLPKDAKNPTLLELRRGVNYTSLLKQYASHTNIVTILSSKPYDMSKYMIKRLIKVADIASNRPLDSDYRYHSDVVFECDIVCEVVKLVRSVYAWRITTTQK
jgi:hypothetical protein